MTRAATFRLMALLLLLVTGVEMIACELIEPERCESFGSSSPAGDAPGGDDCICCCSHIVMIAPFALAPAAEGVSEQIHFWRPKPQHKSFPVYHPPKL